MKKRILISVFLLILQGCAFVHIKTEQLEFSSFTVLKDVQVDPNGIASTTSPSVESVIGTGVGFLMGTQF